MTIAAPERWRCFLGVPIPDEIRQPLWARVATWREELDARWTDPEGWHCSLHFLGSVPAGSIPQIGAAVADAVAGELRFTTTTGGLGAFPTARRARVLFYGIADGAGALARLACATARAASSAADGGRSSPFHAHVTLARLRRPLALDRWLPGRRVPAGRLPVEEVCLMRSHLGSGPARYERVACYPLAAS